MRTKKNLCDCQLAKMEEVMERSVTAGQRIKAMQMHGGYHLNQIEFALDVVIFDALSEVSRICKMKCKGACEYSQIDRVAMEEYVRKQVSEDYMDIVYSRVDL